MIRNIELNRQQAGSEMSSTAQQPLLSVVEVSGTKGQYVIPAIKEVSLALSLSNCSASWRGLRGERSEALSTGTVAICEFDKERSFDIRDDAKFAVVLLRNEALEQVQDGGMHLQAGLQAHDALQDLTLRDLMNVLVREKRNGFSNGLFFLDSLATALASHLVRHYSLMLPGEAGSRGGMAPSILRRSIEFMDAHLEGNLRLSDLAREAGLSASHFIRSFRESTGKTPHQFLLHRRVERARDLMRDGRASLTEVALASGFADQHHLARVFRRIANMTPSIYRRSLQ
jgi:AraC family transcriptional regulator